MLFSVFGVIIFSYRTERRLAVISSAYSFFYGCFSDFIITTFSAQDHISTHHELLLVICYKLLLFTLFFTSIYTYKELSYRASEKIDKYFNKLKGKNKQYITLLKQLHKAQHHHHSQNINTKTLENEIERLKETLIQKDKALDENYKQFLYKEQQLRDQYQELSKIKEEIDIQNATILKQQQLLQEKNQSLEMYTNALLYLNRTKKVNSVTFIKRMKEILVTCVETLEVRYVGIWQYHTDRDAIECIMEYDKKQDVFKEGELFLSKDYPTYFKSILSNNILKADDVQTHPDLKEFLDSYLVPKNITSMLDAPFFVNGTFGGIICIEHEGEARVWNNEEIFFSKSLSEIISNTFMELRSSENEEKIIFQSQELSKKNELLEQQKNEIESIKNYLEERIKERTLELQQKNNRLTEIAKTNSIVLRKPLHRIQGLTYILQEQYKDITEIQDCIKHLKTSSIELEVAVDQINSMLNPFDRSS
ncbi:MAG TPA: GAF domain-containing protein [Cytophagales bacterium]|nr:GAF domain-containing protein [Cytophagales bacterium]